MKQRVPKLSFPAPLVDPTLETTSDLPTRQPDQNLVSQSAFSWGKAGHWKWEWGPSPDAEEADPENKSPILSGMLVHVEVTANTDLAQVDILYTQTPD